MKGVKLVELSEFKVKNYLGSNLIAQFKNFDFMKIFTCYNLRGQNWPYFGPQQTHEKQVGGPNCDIFSISGPRAIE